VIAKNDVRIATDLMLLLMIIDTLLRFFPSQPPRQPVSQVTVNVTVDADEITEKVAKRLEDEGVCVVPEPTTEEKPKLGDRQRGRSTWSRWLRRDCSPRQRATPSRTSSAGSTVPHPTPIAATKR
jgi:hypothetical protein